MIIVRLSILLTVVMLSACAWYQGPEPMPKVNASGDALSEFYSGPTLPDGTIDDGGDYEVTSFDNG